MTTATHGRERRAAAPATCCRCGPADRRVDQEGELALVIGRTARRVSGKDALSHVFGYTGLLDITMRGGEDRSARKSFDTFTPMGPVLVTADEFGNPDHVELRCWVSGELRQKASTRDLIWGVARLVSYASSVTTLHPGDVITTGTPAGVGPLTAGDTIRLELSGLGLDLTARVAADDTIASPRAGPASVTGAAAAAVIVRMDPVGPLLPVKAPASYRQR